jgi:hypothetical protein
MVYQGRFVFSYLTDFSYSPLGKKIQKVAGHDLNWSKFDVLKLGSRWF